jgi:hypothetical protein
MQNSLGCVHPPKMAATCCNMVVIQDTLNLIVGNTLTQNYINFMMVNNFANNEVKPCLMVNVLMTIFRNLREK